MDNNILGLIGLARRAGKAEVGEEPVSIAARTHKARLILLAADAADNTRRKGEGVSQVGNCPCLLTPHTKAELGYALGRSSCAIMALTDMGLASAVAQKLALADPEGCGEAAQRLKFKAEKALRRKAAPKKKL